MWKLILKIAIGLYLVVSSYFTWQYVTHREELAICLEYPKEQFVEFLEDQKANLQSNEGATEAAETAGTENNENAPSFWEKMKQGFLETIERLTEGIKKAEEVASESAAIIEEGKEVADKSQDLYDRTQDLLAEVNEGGGGSGVGNGGEAGGGETGNSSENPTGTPLPECAVVK